MRFIIECSYEEFLKIKDKFAFDRTHLSCYIQDKKEVMRYEVIEIIKENKDLTIKEIREEILKKNINLDHRTVARYLKHLVDEDHVIESKIPSSRGGFKNIYNYVEEKK